MKKKVSKIDYTMAMLPRTRRAQFLDIFRMNFLTIFKCGIMLFLFFIPLLAFSFFMDLYYVSLMQHAAEETYQTAFVFHCFYGAGIVILSMPIIVAITGIIRVLRNLIWQEGIFFKDDFVTGIKQNCGKNMVFAVIFAILGYAAFFILLLFINLIVAMVPIILFALIFLPIFFWMMFTNNNYDSKSGALVRNGVFFYIKSFGWSIVGISMLLSLVALFFLPTTLIWLKYVVLAIFIILVFPTVLLVMSLYTTSKFDLYINKDNYPDYYLRGLNHE